jgi:branched-chain amino acid transport system permease protein
MVAVAIFAGLGNLKGGVIAGFILGLVETFTMAYLPGTWTDAVGFGMMVIVILARPQGVFGDRT